MKTRTYTTYAICAYQIYQNRLANPIDNITKVYHARSRFLLFFVVYSIQYYDYLMGTLRTYYLNPTYKRIS